MTKTETEERDNGARWEARLVEAIGSYGLACGWTGRMVGRGMGMIAVDALNKEDAAFRAVLKVLAERRD